MSIKSKDAEQLLANPILQDAFTNVRENIVCQIESCPLEKTEISNQLMLSLQVLQAIIQEIEYEINTGRLEVDHRPSIN